MLALGVGLSARATQSVSLAWNPSTDTSTAGYIIYAGKSATNLSSQINVGTNTTVTISGLKEGTTNYFAVGAYNSANVVGTPSTPVSYLVPGLLAMSPSASSTRPPLITFPTAVGHWYEVQASTNLITWSNLIQTATATTNAWVSYTDPQGLLPRRFYRLIMH